MKGRKKKKTKNLSVTCEVLIAGKVRNRKMTQNGRARKRRESGGEDGGREMKSMERSKRLRKEIFVLGTENAD